MYWETVLEALFGGSSFILYGAMTAVLIRLRWRLRYFADIVHVNSIINIISYLNMLISNRLRWEPSFAWLYEWLIRPGSWMARSFVFTCYTVSWQMHYAMTFIFAFNRFTAVVMPKRHTTIWQHKWGIILLSLVPELLIGVWKANRTSTFVLVTTDPSWITYKQVHPITSAENGNFLIMFIISTIFAVPSVVLTALTKKNVVEKSTFKISAINVAFMIVNYVHMCLFICWGTWGGSKVLGDYVDKAFPISNDVFCLTLPWTTFFIGSIIRKEFLRWLRVFRIGRSPATVTAIPTSPMAWVSPTPQQTIPTQTNV